MKSFFVEIFARQKLAQGIVNAAAADRTASFNLLGLEFWSNYTETNDDAHAIILFSGNVRCKSGGEIKNSSMERRKCARQEVGTSG